MKYMRVNRLKRLARYTAEILGYQVYRFRERKFYRGMEWFSVTVELKKGKKLIERIVCPKLGFNSGKERYGKI